MKLKVQLEKDELFNKLLIWGKTLTFILGQTQKLTSGRLK